MVFNQQFICGGIPRTKRDILNVKSNFKFFQKLCRPTNTICVAFILNQLLFRVSLHNSDFVDANIEFYKNCVDQLL